MTAKIIFCLAFFLSPFAYLESSEYPKNSGMAAIAKEMNTFKKASRRNLKRYDASLAHAMTELLSGNIHDVSKKSPTDRELSDIIPLIALIGMIMPNEEWDFNMFEGKQKLPVYIHIRVFQKLNEKQNISVDKIVDDLLKEHALRNQDKTSLRKRVILAKNRMEKYLPHPLSFKNIRDFKTELTDFLDNADDIVSANKSRTRKIKARYENERPTKAPLQVNVKETPEETVDHIFDQLKKFETLMKNEGKANEYREIREHIQTLLIMYQKKEDILAYAHNLWQHVKNGDTIPNKAYPGQSIELNKNSGYSFCSGLENYIIFLQKQIGVRYMPVFEMPEYMSLGNILPIDREDKELSFSTIEIHLTDGIKMLQNAVTWLDTHPAYWRDFFYNAFSVGGCIPRRNVMLSNWIEARTKNNEGIYIYEKFLVRDYFYNQVGKLVNYYKEHCINQVIQEDVDKRLDLPSHEIEALPLFEELFTKDNFVAWCQNAVRNAYKAKGFALIFDMSDFNDATKIGDAVDEMYIF